MISSSATLHHRYHCTIMQSHRKQCRHWLIPPLILCDGRPLQLVGDVCENFGSIIGKVQVPHFLCWNGYNGKCFLVLFDLGTANLLRKSSRVNTSWVINLSSCKYIYYVHERSSLSLSLSLLNEAIQMFMIVFSLCLSLCFSPHICIHIKPLI